MSSGSHKIAIFVPSFRGGGAERAMLMFAEGLLELRHRVDFLVAQDDGPLRKALPPGARLVNLAKRKVSLTLPGLISYLRRERPSALYSTIVNANIVAVLARMLSFTACPIVVRESNVLFPEGEVPFARRLSGRIAPMLYGFSDAVISVSEDVATQLSASAPSLRSKLVVAPNPVVSSEMLRLGEETPAHPWLAEQDGTPNIVAAGRLHPQKDFGTLIQAFALVRKTTPARLIILGEGSERRSLEALVRELQLDEVVSLPGFVENPFPYFKRASVFALSSRYEGMPNVLLQAMAFGTPVVATSMLSGAKDVLANPEFGRLVPPANPERLAQALCEAVSLKRSDAAAEFVSQNYSVQRATTAYLEAVRL